MSTQASASKETFDTVSADFYDSCLRGLQYQNKFDISECSEERQASKLWQGADSILLSYIASLGALATDKQTDFGLGNLTSAVGNLKGVTLKTAQQTAIVDAGKGLLSGIFAAQRRDALANVMTQAETPDPAHNCPDGCLIDLVKQLTSIAQDDYAGTILAAEDSRIQLFYTSNIALAEATPHPRGVRIANSRSPKASMPGPVAMEINSLAAVGRLVAFGYYVDEASARQVVAKRKAASDTYVAALNQIVTAHHDIVTAIKDNRPEAIAGIANSFVATYSARLAEIQKAFK